MERSENWMDPVVKKIIRCLGLGSSAFSALHRGAKNKSRPATASPSKNCCHSEEGGADVSSTGREARRRRKRQERKLKLAAEPNPKNAGSNQEPAEDLDATKPSVSDPKNDLDPKTDEADCSTTLDGANSDAPPPIKPSDLKNKADGVDPSPEVDASASSTGPAARRQRQGEKRRERKRVATDTKNVGAATGQQHSASDPIPLQREHSTTGKNVSKGLQEPAASNPKPAHLEHSATGIVLDDHEPLQAPPVDDRNGLHDAALSAAATSTEEWNTVVRKKRRPPPVLPRPVLAPAPAAPPRRTRPSTSVQGHRSPAVAIMGRQCSAESVGLLDDLDGVESFFYKLFDEPEDDEVRARHERYLAACSSLLKIQSKFTYCLACFLRDSQWLRGDEEAYAVFTRPQSSMDEVRQDRMLRDGFESGRRSPPPLRSPDVALQ